MLVINWSIEYHVARRCHIVLGPYHQKQHLYMDNLDR